MKKTTKQDGMAIVDYNSHNTGLQMSLLIVRLLVLHSTVPLVIWDDGSGHITPTQPATKIRKRGPAGKESGKNGKEEAEAERENRKKKCRETNSNA